MTEMVIVSVGRLMLLQVSKTLCYFMPHLVDVWQ